MSRSHGLERVAFQTGMFADAFAESDYVVPNITELGPGRQDVHYTHSIDMFIREGGVATPVWARANGVDSVMFGITFMEEFQGVFVRTDDPTASVADLAGRRPALPIWPRLVFNFWRFAALKGLTSALKVHGVAPDAVRFVDIVEGWDPNERRNVGTQDLDAPARTCSIEASSRRSWRARSTRFSRKGPEAASSSRKPTAPSACSTMCGRPRLRERINNSTPRVSPPRATRSRAISTRLSAIPRPPSAPPWVQENPKDARRLIARECSIEVDKIETYLEPDYRAKFLPRLDGELVDAVGIVKTFLHEHKFINRDFDLGDWVDPRPLAEAYAREASAVSLE